jgi:hypothetical protein
VLIWNAVDLGRKLEEFRIYYDENRVHQSLAALRENDLANRRPPLPSLTTTRGGTIAVGLFQMPIAAQFTNSPWTGESWKSSGIIILHRKSRSPVAQ